LQAAQTQSKVLFAVPGNNQHRDPGRHVLIPRSRLWARSEYPARRPAAAIACPG
jgi:hypothetical protein